jgi:hypothetical protein
MKTTFLLVVLFIALTAGLIAFISLLFSKKDKGRFQKMSSIATILTSLATIVVGIATIGFSAREENREKQQVQPLFSIKIELNQSSEKNLYDNEEFVVVNEGTKTKNKTNVSCCSYLEIEYTDDEYHKGAVTKILPLDGYFRSHFVTGNLDGIIEYSSFSGNNNEAYFNLYQKALNYSIDHEKLFVHVQKKHFFVIEYVDILGESHKIIKTDNTEVDPKEFSNYDKKANLDSKGNRYNIFELNFDEIIDSIFCEE